MSNNYKVAGSMKIIWKVADAPTGPYRAFQKRGWPTAYYGSVGPGSAFDRGDKLASSKHQLAQVREAAMSARAPSEADMSTFEETLLAVLNASVRRYGEDKPLTVGHLRNIVRLAIRARAAREERAHQAAMDALGEDKKWGSD